MAFYFKLAFTLNLVQPFSRNLSILLPCPDNKEHKKKELSNLMDRSDVMRVYKFRLFIFLNRFEAFRC